MWRIFGAAHSPLAKSQILVSRQLQISQCQCGRCLTVPCGDCLVAPADRGSSQRQKGGDCLVAPADRGSSQRQKAGCCLAVTPELSLRAKRGNLPDCFGRAKMDSQTQRGRDCFGTIVCRRDMRWTGSSDETMKGKTGESRGLKAPALVQVLSAA
jgi:hypothetical protein